MTLVRNFRRLLALSFAVIGTARAAELTGTWKAEFDTQVGKQSYVYELKADGEKVAGKATGDINGENRRTVELKDGRLAGDTVTFVEIFAFQGNEIPISYSGKLAGDEIKFTRTVGDIATEELVAKRMKEGGAPGALDAAKLVGTWNYVSGERDGNKVAKERFAGSQVVITEKEIKLGGPGGDFVFTYKLDTTRQPVAIAMEMTAGVAVGATTAGIVALDGGQLKLCYAAMGGAAPGRFEAPAGSGAHLFVLERAAAKAEPAK